MAASSSSKYYKHSDKLVTSKSPTTISMHSIEKTSIDILQEYLDDIKKKLMDKLTEIGQTSLLDSIKSWDSTTTVLQSLTKNVLIQQFKNVNKHMSSEDHVLYQKLYTYFTSDDSNISDVDISMSNLDMYRKFYAWCLIYSIVNDPNNDSIMGTKLDQLVSVLVRITLYISSYKNGTIGLEVNSKIFPFNISTKFIKRINIDVLEVDSVAHLVAIPSYKYFESMKDKIFEHIKQTFSSEGIISLLSSFNTGENINYSFSSEASVYETLELIKQKIYPDVSCYKGNLLRIHVSERGNVMFSINLQEEVLSCTKKYKFIDLSIHFSGESSSHAITCIVEKTPKCKIYIIDLTHIGDYKEYYKLLSLVLRSLFPEFDIVLITHIESLRYSSNPLIDPEGYCATINLLVNYVLCYAYTYSQPEIKNHEDFTLYVLHLLKLMLSGLSFDKFLNLIRNFIILLYQYTNKCFVSRLRRNKRISIPKSCSKYVCVEKFERFKDSEVFFVLEGEELSIEINGTKHSITNYTDDTIKKFAMRIYMCYTNTTEYLQCMYRLIANSINLEKESKLQKYHKDSITDSNHYSYGNESNIYIMPSYLGYSNSDPNDNYYRGINLVNDSDKYNIDVLSRANDIFLLNDIQNLSINL